jgi:YfiH family protein
MNAPQSLRCPLLRRRHAFFTRHGGVSEPPFDSLNFGGREDLPEHVEENRRRGLAHLGADPASVAWLRQVHGNEVRDARPGVQEGDALCTTTPGLALAVATADCYPLLFEDHEAGVAAAAHAGWRGTLDRIAAAAVDAMVHRGARRERIVAAIGPGICGPSYEVGAELVSTFRDAGFPERCFLGRHLDLAAANRFVLLESSLKDAQIWSSGRCSTEVDFFSHRRDRGLTGRMWSVIVL